VDTSEIPQPENGPTEDGGVVRRLLDQAARAYMDGNYSAALEAWQAVLDTDPANPRAREGIKKVSMLQADDSGDEDVPFDPILEEIQGLLKRRSFDEALAACRQSMDGAGPALKNALRRLEQSAERARVVEPEIQRCMVDARRSLQAGKVAEALPHLKQVLSLDQSHPVASRLMEGLRERARRRDTVTESPAPVKAADSDQTELMDAIDRAAESLPASGRPGSDAPLESQVAQQQMTEEDDPAPLGQGLPSSPIGEGPDPSAPEIDLDMISLDDGLDDEGDEVVAGAPMEIELEDGPTPGDEEAGNGTSLNLDEVGRRSAASGHVVESPFEGFEEDEPAAKEAASPEIVDEELPELLPEEPAVDPIDQIAGDSLAAVLGTDDLAPETATIVPRSQSKEASGSPMVRYAALAAVVLVGVLALAWQLGFLSSSQADFSATSTSQEEAAVDDVAGAEATGSEAAAVEDVSAVAAATGAEVATGSSNPRRALVLLEQGQDLFNAGRIPEAAAALAQAQKLDPMNKEIATWIGRAEQQGQAQSQANTEHDSAVAAFKAKEFEVALRKFYRLEDAKPDGPYGGYIANTWYNWGLQFLAAGNLREANNKMDEVLSLKSQDTDAHAIKKLVNDYGNRAKDRAFFSQIEALRYRPLDS
jgi:tetratricopeptide (TPR) repeat protein